MKILMTGYCCQMILGIEWKVHSERLHYFIKHKQFDEGLRYIDGIETSEDKKNKLKVCFKSYRENC